MNSNKSLVWTAEDGSAQKLNKVPASEGFVYSEGAGNFTTTTVNQPEVIWEGAITPTNINTDVRNYALPDEWADARNSVKTALFVFGNGFTAIVNIGIGYAAAVLRIESSSNSANLNMFPLSYFTNSLHVSPTFGVTYYNGVYTNQRQAFPTYNLVRIVKLS